MFLLQNNNILRIVALNLLLVTTCLLSGAKNVYGELVEQPNIVLLFVDDLGWADLGHRHPDIFETPHISKLAEDGLDFEQAYIASPLLQSEPGDTRYGTTCLLFDSDYEIQPNQ
ncbi:MAG: sulfatase-like hydrolase/transferase [Opitutaceae bacterium]